MRSLKNIGVSLFMVAIVVAVIWFSQFSIATKPASAEPAKTQSIVPQDLQTEMSRKDLMDTNINEEFLVDLWHDPVVQKYLDRYYEIYIVMEKNTIYLVKPVNDSRGVDLITIGVDFEVRSGVVRRQIGLNLETKKLDCSDLVDSPQACDQIHKFFSNTKQSAFFAAMKASIMAGAGPKEPRTARK